MKRTLLLTTLLMAGLTVLAAPADTTAGVSMNCVGSHNSTLILFALSILGITAHMLNDIVKEKQIPAPYVYNWHTYWEKAWPGKALSLVICGVVIMVRHEMYQIPSFSNWEGGTMALIGYFGGSVLVPFLSAMNKKFGTNVAMDA